MKIARISCLVNSVKVMTIFKESDFLEQNDVAWLTMLQSWAQLERISFKSRRGMLIIRAVWFLMIR